MKVKCIAIGNRIMGDDGIGIKVAELLSNKINNAGIELIFGETDFEYALCKVEDGDFLFIIDSTYYELVPGEVTFAPLSNFYEKNKQCISQHQPNLINLIKSYGKKVEGFLIGIEIESIEFSTELSEALNLRLHDICKEVYEIIISLKNKYKGE